MKKTLWFKSCVEFADEIEYELHYPTGKNEVIFTGAAVAGRKGTVLPWRYFRRNHFAASVFLKRTVSFIH